MGRVRQRDMSVNDLLSEFILGWENKYKELLFDKSLHGAVVKRRIIELIDAFGVSELLNRYQIFLSTDSDFLLDKRHPLRIFLSQVNSYVRQPKKKYSTGGFARHGQFNVDKWNERRK